MSTQQFQGAVEMNDSVDIKGTLREYREGTRTLTGTVALGSGDSGKALFVDSSADAAGVTVTLPAPAAGLVYKFWVADSTNESTIVTASSENIMAGSIRAATNASSDADGDTITITTGAVIGDHVQLSCDGTNWYVAGWCQVNGGITLTKAT